MKNYLSILLILLLVQMYGQQKFQQPFLIQEAVKTNQILYTLKGVMDTRVKEEYTNADGMYYGKCMLLTMRSRADTPVYIVIPNGLMLLSEDSTTQDMIVTRPEYVNLPPHKNARLRLYAMCTEIHDGMPHKEMKYKIGEMADENLVGITNYIAEKLLQNVAGQGAVWAYTDHASVQELEKYGATPISLSISGEILNSCGIVSDITEVYAEKRDTTKAASPVAPTTISTALPPVQVKENLISLSPLSVYCGAGTILILLGLSAFLLYKVGRGVKKKGGLS